jgi:hypothetical protein
MRAVTSLLTGRIEDLAGGSDGGSFLPWSVQIWEVIFFLFETISLSHNARDVVAMPNMVVLGSTGSSIIKAAVVR